MGRYDRPVGQAPLSRESRSPVRALGRGPASTRSDVAARHPLLLTLVTPAQALAELLGRLAFHCQLDEVAHRRRARCPLAAALGIALGWLHVLRLHVFDVVDEWLA